jgi:hypothetical protein
MTWPTVTEQPLRLEPTSKDPFLDGLSGGPGWPEPPPARDETLSLTHHRRECPSRARGAAALGRAC